MTPSPTFRLRRAASALAVVLAGAAALPAAAPAQEGSPTSLSATNGFYTVNANGSDFGAVTGASHSVGPNRYLTYHGGAGRNMLHSYTSGTDYRMQDAIPAITAIPNGVRQEFSFTGGDDLLVQQESTVTGASEAESVVRFTLRVRNRGALPVKIGARTAIDFMLANDDGPRFAAQGSAWSPSSVRYQDPSFATFSLEDDDQGSPTLRSLWTVHAPSIGATTPDILTMDDCCVGGGGELTPPLGAGSYTTSDNEVYWIWGPDEARSRTVQPGEQVSFVVVTVMADVDGAAPVNETPPSIPENDGIPRVGEPIDADPGTWQNASPLSPYEYEWRRCDAQGDACQSIPGATGPSYTPTEDDLGLRLRVRVIAPGNPTPSESQPTSQVGPAADRSAPLAPTVTREPGNLTTSRTPTFEFTGELGGQFWCALDGGTPLACASPYTPGAPLGDGPHTVAFWQVDEAGNVGARAERTFTVDATAPALPTVSSRPATETSHTTAEIVFAGQPGERFVCKVDDGSFTDCTSPLRLQDLGVGAHRVKLIAVDAAGNGSDPRVIEWTVKAPPAAPVLVSPEVTKDASPRFEFAGEPGGRFWCQIDGGAPVVCASPFTPAQPLADGQHTLVIWQEDASGNAGATLTRTFTVDTEAPAKPVVSARPVESTDATSAEIVFAGQPGSRFLCAVDGGAPAPCASPLKLEGLAPGEHVVTITEVDVAGNVSAPVAVRWTVKAPVTAPKTPAAKPTFTATVANRPASPETGGRGQGPNAAATVTVKDKGVDVGCRMTGVDLASCRVQLYAEVADRAAASARVLVGAGVVEAGEKTNRLGVRVELNATGRALMRRSPEGLKVLVAITGKPVTGEAIKATSVARLVPSTATLVVDGYAPDHARLSPAAQRTLRVLAETLRDGGKVRIAGHTDNSADDARYLRRLGLKRAALVRQYLAAHGANATYTVVTRAATAPRATNRTEAGRALNRRVVLTVVR